MQISSGEEDERDSSAQIEAQAGLPGSVEAREWLSRPGAWKTISGGPGDSDPQFLENETALEYVERLYELGAVRVIASNVEGWLEQDEHQDTDTLIVELSSEIEHRRKLFAVENEHSQARGYDPAPDVGQRFLLLWWD